MNKENTILIVDDELMIRDLLGSLLKMNGFSVIKASSGEEVLEMLNGEFLPRKVITDLNMLVISGNEVGKAIKAHDSSIEVFLCYAPGFGFHNEKLPESEFFNGIITKPFKFTDLLGMISSKTT